METLTIRGNRSLHQSATLMTAMRFDTLMDYVAPTYIECRSTATHSIRGRDNTLEGSRPKTLGMRVFIKD